MRLVYVNNVHICENAIIKRKHTMEITDEYHVIFQEFVLSWRGHFIQVGSGYKNNLKPHFYSKLQFNKLLSLSLDIREFLKHGEG